MKRIVALLLLASLVLSLCSCKEKSADVSTAENATAETVEKKLSPAEKIDNYVMQKGVQNGEEYVLDCPEVAAKFSEYDFTISKMNGDNDKASLKCEFKVIKGADGIRLELLDSSLTFNGIKLERSVVIYPNDTFDYKNSIVLDGANMSVHLQGEFFSESYDKDTMPVITKSEFVGGASLSDTVKKVMKQYVDLALDSYSCVLADSELNLTLSDVGYVKYLPQQAL